MDEQTTEPISGASEMPAEEPAMPASEEATPGVDMSAPEEPAAMEEEPVVAEQPKESFFGKLLSMLGLK